MSTYYWYHHISLYSLYMLVGLYCKRYPIYIRDIYRAWKSIRQYPALSIIASVFIYIYIYIFLPFYIKEIHIYRCRLYTTIYRLQCWCLYTFIAMYVLHKKIERAAKISLMDHWIGYISSETSETLCWICIQRSNNISFPYVFFDIRIIIWELH